MTGSSMCIVAAVGAALLVGSPVAQADPKTPLSVIEASAAQLCAAIDADPTDNGVAAGIDALGTRGMDEMDNAMVLISAVHHVCPQHETLMMGLMDSAAAEEVCDRRV